MTFFLVWVVFASAVDPRGTFKSIAGLAIGLTITIDILFGGPVHRRRDEPGAGLRSQLVGDHGPMVGSGTPARCSAPPSRRLIYEFLYLRPRDSSRSGRPRAACSSPARASRG